MLRNYLTVAFRTLRRHKGHAAINVFGLAAGMAGCLLIGLYVRDERSFDRYHENADRIFRVADHALAKTSPAVASALETSLPHLVEQAVRVWPMYAPAKVRRGDVVFVETDVAFVDPDVFRVFSWPARSGNLAAALAAPRTMVLTRSMAEKYFGDEDPIGATLEFWGGDVQVTGVIEDVPANSHYRFDFLVSFSTLREVFGDAMDEEWSFPAFYTYALLKPGAAPRQVEDALARMYGERLGSPPAASLPLLQPLPEIHLRSDLQGEIGPGGSLATVNVLSTVALLVLLLACINFVNLTTARASARAKEVGMRKALGAQRYQLAVQFLGEAVLLSLAALAVALVLIEVGMPAFNRMTGKAVAFRLTADAELAAGVAGIALAVGLLAGAYPALLLSSFRPALVLKGTGGPAGSGRSFRNGLVVFQFTAATALSVAAAVVLLQLEHVRNKDLGFDQEHVVVVDGDNHPLLKEALRGVPGVVGVAGAPQVFGRPLPSSRYEAEGTPDDSMRQMLSMGGTVGFVETMGLEVVAGRSFAEGSAADETGAFMLNESAARALGWADPRQALGQAFAMMVPPDEGGEEVRREGRIVGVVRDFHHRSLHHRVEPLALFPSRDLNLTFIRVREVNREVMAAVEAVWNRVNPDDPFNPYFLDEHLQRQYGAEQRLSRTLGFFTALAVLIACLGLFGLAAFAAERRTKEIGIRKVLGASVGSIVGLLSADFLRLVLLAVVAASPLAYLAMNRWLETFAYRIDLSPWVFLAAGGLALLVALGTVSYQAVRAALADPVKSLRYE